MIAIVISPPKKYFESTSENKSKRVAVRPSSFSRIVDKSFFLRSCEWAYALTVIVSSSLSGSESCLTFSSRSLSHSVLLATTNWFSKSIVQSWVPSDLGGICG
jgi:hypothetical protein